MLHQSVCLFALLATGGGCTILALTSYADKGFGRSPGKDAGGIRTKLALLMSYFWPGFFRLWLRGQWRGLLPASAFAMLLNLALTATFIWPELLSKHVLLAAWGGLAGVWVVSVVRIRREIPRFPSNTFGGDSMAGLFIRAQAEYLRGNWFEAESLLQHLASAGEDVEARLMLATLYRRTGRLDQAKRQLRVLAQLSDASTWSFEIRRELQLVRQAASAGGPIPGSGLGGSQESGMPEAA